MLNENKAAWSYLWSELSNYWLYFFNLLLCYVWPKRRKGEWLVKSEYRGMDTCLSHYPLLWIASSIVCVRNLVPTLHITLSFLSKCLLHTVEKLEGKDFVSDSVTLPRSSHSQTSHQLVLCLLSVKLKLGDTELIIYPFYLHSIIRKKISLVLFSFRYDRHNLGIFHILWIKKY